MPRGDFLAKYRPKLVVALFLTFASGLVDIIGFLGIYHLFTAHVTGTTVHLGSSLVLRRGTEVSAGLAAVGAFFLGSLIGRAVVEAASRRRFRRIASVTLVTEAALLAIVSQATVAPSNPQNAAASTPAAYWYLAILAGAMGLQTATLTGIGPLTVHTTFVTGMVNKLAQLVSRIFFRSYDLLTGHRDTPEARAHQSAESQQAVFLFAIWVCYVAGAAGGTAAYITWGIRALFVAIAALAIGIATDFFHPLSIEEEREQSER